MDLLQWAVLIEGIITIAAAGTLAWLGFRNRIVWLAVTVMGGFGVLTFLQLSRQAGAWSIGPLGRVEFMALAYSLVLFAEFTFALLYPSFRPVGWRGRLVGLAVFPILVSILFLGARIVGANELYAFLAQVQVVLRNYLPPLSLLLLANTYLRARTIQRRTQLLYACLPFIVWALNHATFGLFAHVFRDGALEPQPFGSGLAYAAAFSSFLAAAAWDAARRPQFRRQNLALVAWSVSILPLTFLQFIAFNLHLLVDGLTVVFLFYAIARYQIVKVDFTIPSPTRQAVRGAFALPLFFIAQQAVEATAFNRSSSIVAATVITGLSLFVLQLAQNRLTRATAQGVPRDLAAYEAYRRLEVYRTALDGVYADGAVDPAESKTLAGLRHKLGISLAEHRALEQDIRASLQDKAALAA